jgi:hypothetical protein
VRCCEFIGACVKAAVQAHRLAVLPTASTRALSTFSVWPLESELQVSKSCCASGRAVR